MSNSPLPQPDAPVVIARAGVVTTWPSRVASLEPIEGSVSMTVDVPDGFGDVPPTPGSALVVRWKDGDRNYAVPVDVVAAGEAGWQLRPTAPATWHHGERRHERGSFDAVLGFRLAGRDVRGRGVDVSEGGLRCELLDDPGPAKAGDRVTVEFDAADEYILTFATVVRMRATGDGTTELALRFEGLKPGAADSIKRHVDSLTGGG